MMEIFKEVLMKILVSWVAVLMMCIGLSSFGFAYKPGDRVVLKTSVTCHYCRVAEKMLDKKHIPYKNVVTDSGITPELIVNGKSLGYGSETVKEYINS